MNILRSKTIVVSAFLLVVGMQNTYASDVEKGAEHDKLITQVKINAPLDLMPQRLFMISYTGGPLMTGTVQELPGVVLNGIQDFALSEQKKGRWQPGQYLTIKLANPLLVNPTTHNFEPRVSIEALWGVQTDTLTEEHIDKMVHKNTLVYDIKTAKDIKIDIEIASK